jgi:isocitrate dehydrogenase kinase/phosphatase
MRESISGQDIELHALEHHFFRNKAAYIVGRIAGKGLQIPFCDTDAAYRE